MSCPQTDGSVYVSAKSGRPGGCGSLSQPITAVAFFLRAVPLCGIQPWHGGIT